MFGFLVGTVCLVGLIKVLRHGRWAHHGCGYHGHHGHGGCGGGGWGRYRGRGWGGEGWHDDDGPILMRSIFSSLNLSAEQRAAVREALEEFQQSTKALRGEVAATRKDVARAMRHPSFDEEALAEAFARHDEVMAEFRKALVGALAKVHAPLDEGQRDQLAQLIESGPMPWRLAHGGVPAFAA
ncbi:MAG: periplasmic heavy metal sensor [Myxococcota bacterium]